MFFAEVMIVDLYMFSFLFIFFLTFLIWNVTFFLGESNTKYYHKSFNCGFEVDQYTQTINSNIRFFVVALLFLLFDVELILMLPVAFVPSISDFTLLISFYIFFILLTCLMILETSKDLLSLV